MIDTGGTIVNAAKALKKEGCKDIYVFASHGLFSGNAAEKLNNPELIKKIVVTNTIEKERDGFDNLEVISIAELIASAIQRVVDNMALTPLFQ